MDFYCTVLSADCVAKLFETGITSEKFTKKQRRKLG